MPGCMIRTVAAPSWEQPAPPLSEVALFPFQIIVSSTAQANESTRPLIISNPKMTWRENEWQLLCTNSLLLILSWFPLLSGVVSDHVRRAHLTMTLTHSNVQPLNHKVVLRWIASTLLCVKAASWCHRGSLVSSAGWLGFPRHCSTHSFSSSCMCKLPLHSH